MANTVLVKLDSLAGRVFKSGSPFLLLVIRVLVGYAMFRSGYGKLTDIERTVGFFDGLGLPAPEIHVYLVAGAEMLGGLLFMAGLLTRFSAAMITVVMVGALLLDHRDELAKLFSAPYLVVAAAPMPYLITYLLVGITGPGRFSLDRMLFGTSES
jgi:putative oxidoreductase